MSYRKIPSNNGIQNNQTKLLEVWEMAIDHLCFIFGAMSYRSIPSSCATHNYIPTFLDYESIDKSPTAVGKIATPHVKGALAF